MYMYAVAAGFIAGEGMGGIVTAVLQIAGVSGAFYGTAAVSGQVLWVVMFFFARSSGRWCMLLTLL